MLGFKNLKDISSVVRPRNVTQRRTHMNKYHFKLIRDRKRLRLDVESKDGANIENLVKEEI